MSQQPTTARLYRADDRRPATGWEDARRRLGDAKTYWLVTVRPDGRPHSMPVLSVLADDSLYFCAGATTRKARNLARSSQCVITTTTDDLDLVVEGTATLTRDPAQLQRVADVYRAKYRWDPDPRDGAFRAEGAPTAGPPPLDLYRVDAATVFAFGTKESRSAMRWTF